MSTLNASRPTVSSPLAGPTHASSGPATTRITPQRTYSFPTSRALRPFASITPAAPAPGKKPVKMIQPPATQPSFALNLTQAEFSRQ